mmetsp:Transcript_45324/g.75589  ORF Transcript_45324/g.75589 Transcript_45324/m.75589 type:complete len:382 (-) Transcript_45324:207-1352(-)
MSLVGIICQKCKKPRWKDAKFCIHCGTLIEEPKKIGHQKSEAKGNEAPPVLITENEKFKMIFEQFDVDQDGYLNSGEMLALLREQQHKEKFNEEDYLTFCEALTENPKVGISLDGLNRIYSMGERDIDTDWELFGLKRKWQSTLNQSKLDQSPTKKTAPPAISPRAESSPNLRILQDFDPTHDTVIGTGDSKFRRSRREISKALRQATKREKISPRRDTANLLGEGGLILVKEGYLTKRGAINSAFKKRFCRLFHSPSRSEAYFQYYKNEGIARKKKDASGTIVITLDSQLELDPQKKTFFHLAPVGVPNDEAKLVFKNIRVFVFKADSAQVAKSWTNQIKAIVDSFKAGPDGDEDEDEDEDQDNEGQVDDGADDISLTEV